MIDIHQHVVFGVDDGASSFNETKRMILSAQKQGVKTIFATSHARTSMSGFRSEQYFKALDEICEWISQRKIKIQFLSGSEILYSSDTLVKLDSGVYPTLDNTEWVLIEFLPDTDYSSMFQGLRAIINAGYKPILAHVERYRCLAGRTMSCIEDLKGISVRLQMNSNTVISNDKLFKNRFVHMLLKKGYVDYVASDAHNTTMRPVKMAQAYGVLEKQYGLQVAKSLCGRNQEKDIMV